MTEDYQRMARAIQFLRDQTLEQPSLDQAAAEVGLSPFHFQRLFRRWAGVSPKRFLQILTADHAKELLLQSQSILETTFSVGLSSPGRLHDLMVSVEAVTPGEYKSRGEGLRIEYGHHMTPFGEALIAITPRGICQLSFLNPSDEKSALEQLRLTWPRAELKESMSSTAPLIQQIFYNSTGTKPLPLLLSGTNFQIKVWQALLQIPVGAISSYGFLAEKLGQPGASRAVGTATGQNPIAYLIPCHRVLRADGHPGGYRWGVDRKLSILGQELSEQEATTLDPDYQ